MKDMLAEKLVFAFGDYDAKQLPKKKLSSRTLR